MRGMKVADGPFRTVVIFILFMFSQTGFADESRQFEQGLKAYNQGDYQSAYTLILPVASKGEPPALNLLGMMYELGLGVTRDEKRSVNYYRQAADKGYSYAQYNLAVSYDTGIGVSLNYREAVKWYKRAAEQGTSIAQYNLGVMYEEGRGIPRSHKEAAYWYHRAAEQGHAQAQNNLAWLYETGQGLEMDLVSAYAWFDIAADQGVEPAIHKRDLLKKRLNETEMTQAANTSKTIRKAISTSSK